MLKDLLAELDRDQLQSLLLKLTEREPGLNQVIEELIGSQKSTPPKEILSQRQHHPNLDAAVRWLAKARTSYLNMGRKEEWDTYLSELLNRHQRKYKLVPMLKALK